MGRVWYIYRSMNVCFLMVKYGKCRCIYIIPVTIPYMDAMRMKLSMKHVLVCWLSNKHVSFPLVIQHRNDTETRIKLCWYHLAEDIFRCPFLYFRNFRWMNFSLVILSILKRPCHGQTRRLTTSKMKQSSWMVNKRQLAKGLPHTASNKKQSQRAKSFYQC